MLVLSKDVPLFSGIARAWSVVEVLDRYKNASGDVLLNVKVDGKEIYGLTESSVIEKKLKDPF